MYYILSGHKNPKTRCTCDTPQLYLHHVTLDGTHKAKTSQIITPAPTASLWLFGPVNVWNNFKKCLQWQITLLFHTDKRDRMRERERERDLVNLACANQLFKPRQQCVIQSPPRYKQQRRLYYLTVTSCFSRLCPHMLRRQSCTVDTFSFAVLSSLCTKNRKHLLEAMNLLSTLE